MPSPGTVYTIAGKPRLYVRTEQRPGKSGPEHLFVHVESRVVLQHWTSEVPAEAELVIDTGGRGQAEQEKWLRLAAEHEIGIVVGLLKQACEMLPKARADELRHQYRETRA